MLGVLKKIPLPIGTKLQGVLSLVTRDKEAALTGSPISAR